MADYPEGTLLRARIDAAAKAVQNTPLGRAQNPGLSDSDYLTDLGAAVEAALAVTPAAVAGSGGGELDDDVRSRARAMYLAWLDLAKQCPYCEMAKITLRRCGGTDDHVARAGCTRHVRPGLDVFRVEPDLSEYEEGYLTAATAGARGATYVAEGWWHPNTNAGRVHDHPERPGRSWSEASHRLCERVYTRRGAPDPGPLAALRSQVEHMRSTRMQSSHSHGSPPYYRQEGEGNAFDIVLRLIDGEEPDRA